MPCIKRAKTSSSTVICAVRNARTAVSVTIPLIRDTVQTAYIYLGIAALDGFVYVMALNPFGGPDNSTLVMSQDLYNTALRQGQFGYATSTDVVPAVVTLLWVLVTSFKSTQEVLSGSAPCAPMCSPVSSSPATASSTI